MNLKHFAQVELSYHCHHRYDVAFGDGLRPGSIADANESLRTGTTQFGELEVQGELTRRALVRPARESFPRSFQLRFDSVCLQPVPRVTGLSIIAEGEPLVAQGEVGMDKFFEPGEGFVTRERIEQAGA